ncbi:MAG: 50S ribosomal protein L13, partial [Micavibrio aeruginosavorus]
LARKQLKNLKVYVSATHPHEAQSPKVVDVAGMNPKNKRA